jgi:tRNA(Ile)-lysidine synthase
VCAAEAGDRTTDRPAHRAASRPAHGTAGGRRAEETCDGFEEDAAPVTDVEAQQLFAGLGEEAALVLAVSGGPDSTALLWLAARWRKQLKKGPKLHAATIDHGLRDGSRAEAAAVKRIAKRLGVAHRTLRWTGRKPATGIQEAARAERYRLLAGAARRVGARCVLTAHTLDDQAETVLFRLARGSGMTGLAAMARVTPLAGAFIVRPLLDVAKARLVATVRAAALPFARDPSNTDPRFTRARLRQLMPSLAREGLEPRRLALLARRLRRADAAVEAVTDFAAMRLTLPPAAAPSRQRRAEPASQPGIPDWPALGPIELDRDGFAVLPEEIALRLIGRALTRVGDEGPVELGKLEVLTDDLRAALRKSDDRFRRTLAGGMVSLGKRLRIERAPPRRGRSRAASGTVAKK